MFSKLGDMFKGSTNSVKDVLAEKERYEQEAKLRHIRDIMKKPLNLRRVDFCKHFLSAEYAKNMTEEYVRQTLAELTPMFGEGEEGKLIAQAHSENLESFLTTGDIAKPLNLKTEEGMFFWGTVLAYLAAHPEIQQNWPQKNQYQGGVSNSALWRRVASSSYMQTELQKHAYSASRMVDNPDVKIVWGEHGYPNVNYCFIPDENLIVDDLLWTLISGTDAAATAMGHEIAHSQGTIYSKSPRMEEIKTLLDDKQKQVEAAGAAGDDKKVRDLIKEAGRLNIEYKYRYFFLDELENMYANRYAVVFGGDFDKAHLNELEIDFNLGEKYLEPTMSIKDKGKLLKEDVVQEIMHIKALARNSFFANNGIIGEERAEWHQVGLYPELLSGVRSDGKPMGSAEAFERLREICNDFENSQPSKGLRDLNATLYHKRMEAMSKHRSEMVDVFFDQFVAPLMEKVYQKEEEKMQQQLQNQQQGQGQSQDQQQGQGQGQSQDQQQQGQGQGQSQDQQQGQGQGQSQNQQQQGQGLGQSQDQQRQGQGQGQRQQGQSTEKTPFSTEGIDEPRRPFTKEEIAELLKKAETLRELKEQAEENGLADEMAQKEAQEQEMQRQQREKKQQEEERQREMTRREKPILVDLDTLREELHEESESARFYREGNWDEYQKYIAQYADEIAEAKKLLAKILEQNKRDSLKRGDARLKTKRTILPVQGGSTLDLQKHLATQKKLLRGDPHISRKDFERFKTSYSYSEEEKIKEIEIPPSHVGILIDGSGSMTGRPFDNALAISCILYEAARSFKEVNLYVYMMGDSTPLTVALPGDNTKEIAKRLESVRDGQGGCNDHLTPAISQFLKDVCKEMEKKPFVKSGFTHIFSVTDGGNGDYSYRDVNRFLEKMLENNEQLTFDSFFMDEHWENYTKPLIREMKSKGCQRIDCVDGIVEPEDIKGAIRDMLMKRMRHSSLQTAQTNTVKKENIQKTIKSLNDYGRR